MPKVVIQGNLHCPIGAKTIGASGHDADFVVQALDCTARQLTLRSKPIQNQRFMAPEHPGRLLHRCESTPQRPGGPTLQESGRVAGRTISPKMLKRFFEDPGPTGRQLAADDLVQLGSGLATHPAAPPQELPAHFLESLRPGLALQPGRFRPAHVVHRLVQVPGDMKAIQDMQRVPDVPGDHVEVGLPHVAANKPQALDYVRTEGVQAAAQTGLRAAGAEPQQTPTMPVDLINHGEKVGALLAPAPMDLVHANRFDPVEFAVRQPPFHEPLDRPINRFPTGAEDARGFAPRQAPGPAGQEAHRGGRDPLLARIPRQMFDHDAMHLARHPPRRVNILGREAPQRHEHPTAFLQPVIARAERMAVTAARPAARAGLYLHLDFRCAPRGGDQAHAAVNETHEGLHQVQERLHCQLRGWCGLFHTHCDGRSGSTVPATRCFFLQSGLWFGAGGEDQSVPSRSPR